MKQANLELFFRFLTYKYNQTHYSQPHIVATVFHEVNKILNQWLSPVLYEEHKKQICESAAYRVQTVNLSDILAEELNEADEDDLLHKIDNNNEGSNDFNSYFVENNYEDRKIYIKQVIMELNREDIIHIWRVTSLLAKSNNANHYVILLKDGSHVCTCLLLTNSGVICRHYFKVMMDSNDAKFHISLIPRRWYKENLQEDEQSLIKSDIITLGNGLLEEKESEPKQFVIKFNQDSTFSQQYQDNYTQKRHKKKNEYASIIGLAKASATISIEIGDCQRLKKLLSDYHTELLKIKEEQQASKRLQAIENRQSHDIISVTDGEKLLFEVDGKVFATQEIQEPLEHIAKGRPPNKRIKSAIETSKRSNKENKKCGNNAKKDYVCGKCNNVGHNARTCRN